MLYDRGPPFVYLNTRIVCIARSMAPIRATGETHVIRVFVVPYNTR